MRRETHSAPQKRLKVARIIARLNIGGPAIQACYLHQALRPEFDTVLITGHLDEGEGDMSYLLKSDDGVQWLGTMSRPVRIWSDITSLFRLVRILRRERPDIVHTHTAKAGTIGRVAALFAGVPVLVHTYHGHIFRGKYFGPAVTRVFLAIERFLARFTDVLVAVSESQASELSSEFRIAPRSKFRVIRNGYDLAPFAGSPRRADLRRAWGISDSEILVVWAGRLVPVKNVELLAAIIREARANAALRFVVVGDGSERGKLQSLLGGCDNVRLVGWSSDMPAVWAAADVALVTSKNEGTPSALIEAMAAARPFVSTPAGGVVDLCVGTAHEVQPGVRGYENGFLFDSTASTAIQALQCLQRDPQAAARMGAAGQSFAVENFSLERLIRDITALYACLAKRSPLGQSREMAPRK